MNRVRWLNLGYALFNVAAILVLGNAGWNAYHAHDFIPFTIFGVVMAAYCFGLLLYLLRSDHAKTVNERLNGGGIYLVAAFFTDVTVEDSLFDSSASGYPLSGWPAAITKASLIGSLLLVLAFLLMLIKPRYAKLPGLVGACLAWPYFGYMAWILPWRDFVWFVTIHWSGELQMIAIFSLVLATSYSIFGCVYRPKVVG